MPEAQLLETPRGWLVCRTRSGRSTPCRYCRAPSVASCTRCRQEICPRHTNTEQPKDACEPPCDACG